MKIKVNSLLFICALFFAGFFVSAIAMEPSGCIDCTDKDISWVNGLNNSVMVIKFDNGEKKYFKECKKKLDMHSEVKRIIEDYLNEYSGGRFLCDKDLLTQTLFEPDNFKKFTNAGFLWESSSELSKYVKGRSNSGCLGIPCAVANRLHINVKDFLLYSSREFVHREISCNIKEGDFQTNLAVKQLATYKLAEFLGLENIVVKSEFVKLSTAYGEKRGIITNQAEGKAILGINKKKLKISPNLQFELTCLQILDTITREMDHSPENCFFKINGNLVEGITAFDNEGCFGLSENMSRGLCWNRVSPLITKAGKINLPYMDEALANKILKATNEDINNIFGGILSSDQLKAVKARFNAVKSAIRKTVSQNKGFLLSRGKWSLQTVSCELSQKYGNTYLNHFVKTLNIRR